MNKVYEHVKKEVQEIADINYAASVLSWDQETYIPPKGNKYRAQQLATLSQIAHAKATTDSFGKLLNKLSEAKDLTTIEAKNVSLLLKDYNKAKKLPSDYVVRLSKATSHAFHTWVEARKANDFLFLKKP
ncbi:MAG: hypothetical protein LRY27_03115 [Chitinophagales bacterium]|nr:hypothetical protein [Chitinophagales bacterium]